MPEDFPPDPAPVPIAPPSPRGRGEARPVCEHCGCRLTASGEIIEMSDKARAHRRATETIENLKHAIEVLTRERDDIKHQLADAVAAKTVAESSTLFPSFK